MNDFQLCRSIIFKVTKEIFSGMMNDLDHLRLDPDASNVAFLWQTIDGMESGTIANEIKHCTNSFPTQLELYEKVETEDFRAVYKEMLSIENYKELDKCIKNISQYMSADRNIYSLILLSLLTGNQDESKHLNRTLNKMLLKKLHQKHPYQGDEIIDFLKGQLVKITKILPFWFELPKDEDEPSRFEEVPNEKFCQNCKDPYPLFHCSNCKSVWYCNANCQSKDWPQHKLVCKSSK